MILCVSMGNDLEKIDDDVGGDGDKHGDHLARTLLLQERDQELAVKEEPEPVGIKGMPITRHKTQVRTTLTPPSNNIRHQAGLR